MLPEYKQTKKIQTLTYLKLKKMKSTLLLCFVFVVLLAGVNTIKIKSHNIQKKAVHNLFSMMHLDDVETPSDDDIFNDPGFQFLFWMLEHSDLMERLGNGTSTDEDRQTIKQYLLDHPEALVSILSDSPSAQECFGKMNNDQKNKFAKIVIQNTDFSSFGSQDENANRFNQDQLDAIQDAASDDDDLSPFVDVCIASLNKKDKPSA